jgi:hypothetical protein
MSNRSAVRCTTIQVDGRECRGSLGAWIDGEFHPALHLLPSRDLWISPLGIVRLRCSFCGTVHVILREDGRLTIKPAA